MGIKVNEVKEYKETCYIYNSYNTLVSGRNLK